MTSSERQTIKAKIDAAVRQRIATSEEVEGDLVMDEEVPDTEENRRLYLLWKAQPWRLFTRCSSHGDQAYCAGPTRDSVICLRCYAAGPTTKRRRKMSANTTTSGVSLREPFEAKISETLDGVEIVSKVAYSRAVKGKATLAYINGDRKLTVEVRRAGETGLDKFKIASEDEFGPAIEAMGALDAALLAKASEVAAPAPASEPEVEPEVEPDPKPAKKSRSRKARAAA